ncbi:hypothetical protein FC093_23215 [Ilyomonas limi]|uniref:Uncharacterized protein n=1 Tax=Ilyomonas limi TaxID=2575867 RepID=A0A4U3KPP4_9BACT|nr:hypothetical protein [Ilyomonas limi]TKK64140.1 hypothetical protein FC093_23215 [Ilyomonas limi]
MAKQTGILPIEGTIGNITFFKSKDGYMVRSKGGVSASKIATDAAFQRTRENMAEFGRAGSAGKLLRTSLRSTIVKAKDNRMVSRLTAQMLKVVQADATSDRGQRNVIDGEATLLEGFDFNSGAKLSATLYAPYTLTFTRSTGTVQVSITDFIPPGILTAPTGTTHFQLFMAAAAIDFEAATYDAVSSASGELVYSHTATGAITLSAVLPPNSTHPVFLVLGVEFLQQVNGKQYSLNNGAFNACSIVKVDSPV